VVILSLLLVIFTLTLLPPIPTNAAVERPVIAFYYTGYDLGNWTREAMSDLPVPLYSASDGDTMERHIQQAHDAGINAFVCQWAGPYGEITDERCQRLQKRIHKSGYDMGMALLPNLSSETHPEIRTEEGLRHTIQTLKDEFVAQPGYLRFQGKPVVFWLNPNFYGDVEMWRRLRNQVDLNREMFWMVGTDIPSYEEGIFSYLHVFDAVYPYDISRHADPYEPLSAYATRLISYNQAHNTKKPFILTVTPGHDDTRVNPNGYYRDRNNGNYYRASWATASHYRPDAVVLRSFNGFYQGTHIEPSELYGTTYLDLTKQLVSEFRSSLPADNSAIYISQTGHFLKGAFRAFWEQHGREARFGYPITEEFIRLHDQKLVQYFERARFELRVVNGQAYVDLGLLGKEYVDAHELKFPRVTPLQNTATQRYFPETGHSIQGSFKQYWEQLGGMEFLGYPLSEEHTEQFPDGSHRTVQYFERVRLELHDNGVMMSLLGRILAPCELQAQRARANAPIEPIREYDSDPCRGNESPPQQSPRYTDPQPQPQPQQPQPQPQQPQQPDPSAPAPAQPAKGRVYPTVVQPGTVQGFEAWNYAPNEVVSLWLNLPDGTVRPLPYRAPANAEGYVLIGFQTEKIDPVGHWQMVGKGVQSGRTVVAPFELRW
jgi:hypothetical protein